MHHNKREKTVTTRQAQQQADHARRHGYAEGARAARTAAAGHCRLYRERALQDGMLAAAEIAGTLAAEIEATVPA